MAKDARIRFIAELVDRFSGKAKNIKTSMVDMEKGAKKTEKSWSSFAATIGVVTTAAIGFGVAAKKAFDLAQEGAQVEQMKRSFAGLGISMKDLRRASGGTVDDMTLWASSAKLVAGVTGELRDRMAEAAPQLLEVARAAVKLDPSIGSVAYVFESLARGIKKNQPLLIDNSNIAVKVGDANKKMAAQLGKSVDELTEEEKALALLNETLRAGNEIIEQVGGSVDSLTDSYARVTAASKNWADTQKAALSQSLTPFVESLANELEQTNLINQAIADGIITQEDYANALHHTAGRFENLDELMRYVNHTMEAGKVLNERYASSLEPIDQKVQEIKEKTPINIMEDIDPNVFSSMDRAIEQIEFMIAGGADLQAKFEAAWAAAQSGQIPLEAAKNLINDLRLEAIALQLETNKITMRQAIAAARDLGMSYKDAYNYVGGIINKTRKLDGMTATVYVDIITSGKLPKVTSASGKEYQAEQAGGDIIIPPKFTGDTALMRFNAGERVRTTSASQTRQSELEAYFAQRDIPDRIADRLAYKLVSMGAIG